MSNFLESHTLLTEGVAGSIVLPRGTFFQRWRARRETRAYCKATRTLVQLRFGGDYHFNVNSGMPYVDLFFERQLRKCFNLLNNSQPTKGTSSGFLNGLAPSPTPPDTNTDGLSEVNPSVPSGPSLTSESSPRS